MQVPFDDETYLKMIKYVGHVSEKNMVAVD